MTEGAPNSVRLARTSDVDDIAAVQVRAWRTAYADVLSGDVLGSLDESDIALEWGRALLMPGSSRLLVAVDADGRVVGAAAIGPAGDPDAQGSGELTLLVVDPAAWGHGHGSRLLAASIDLLVQMGFREAVAWVPMDDEGRRRFLQSAGWGPDSAFRDLEADDGGTVREVRLVTLIAE